MVTPEPLFIVVPDKESGGFKVVETTDSDSLDSNVSPQRIFSAHSGEQPEDARARAEAWAKRLTDEAADRSRKPKPKARPKPMSPSTVAPRVRRRDRGDKSMTVMLHGNTVVVLSVRMDDILALAGYPEDMAWLADTVRRFRDYVLPSITVGANVTALTTTLNMSHSNKEAESEGSITCRGTKGP